MSEQEKHISNLSGFDIWALRVVRDFPRITFIGLDAFNIPTFAMRDLADRGLVRKLFIGWEITSLGRQTLSLTERRSKK